MRGVLGVALAVAMLAAAAAAWWFLWYPNDRPSLRAGESYGLDVSNHQGPIDWPTVAADDDDLAFAYIKATEGETFVDARFAENWAGAEQAGLQRGAYHFFTLCRPGLEQAENFLRTAPPVASALPPAVDLELAGNCSRRPSTAAVDAELDAFLAEVEAAWGRDVLLYVGEDWEDRYPVLERSQRPRWLVSHVGRPDTTWTVWQFLWVGRVDGIDGRVDVNVARLDDLDAR
ncbi:GH25 family lysozyme [Jannaschia sp. R86511]|uniref:GH25 family lysozyme n=1 Tax=Jannaschia sp. R86511 TaxID=3093853 RepID=UPI0036D2F9FB